MNIFDSPQVVAAFAQAEKLLGGQAFKLADGRTLQGTLSRIHRGEIELPNGRRILADSIITATRPQFTQPGAREVVPEALSDLTIGCERWRAEYVDTDETHVTLYIARMP